MLISVSSYSFAQYVDEGKLTYPGILAKAKELGFSTVEFIDMPGENHEEQEALAIKLRAEADRLGMAISGYTVSANLYKNNPEEDKKEVVRLKKQIDLAHILGAGFFRHDACWRLYKTGNGRSFDLMLPAIAASARELTEYAAQYGIRTCVENHGKIAQDSDRMERLFNAVNHGNFGLLVDIGNFCCVDEDSVTAVSRLAPYAIHVHAKDMHLRTEPESGFSPTRGFGYFKGAVLGEGDIDVRRCLEILKSVGYDGQISIEFEGSEDCIESIAKGRRYLETCLA